MERSETAHKGGRRVAKLLNQRAYYPAGTVRAVSPKLLIAPDSPQAHCIVRATHGFRVGPSFIDSFDLAPQMRKAPRMRLPRVEIGSCLELPPATAGVRSWFPVRGKWERFWRCDRAKPGSPRPAGPTVIRGRPHNSPGKRPGSAASATCCPAGSRRN